jgi:hypothetical protein
MILSSLQNQLASRSSAIKPAMRTGPTPFPEGWVPARMVILYRRLLPKTNVFILAEGTVTLGARNKVAAWLTYSARRKGG